MPSHSTIVPRHHTTKLLGCLSLVSLSLLFLITAAVLAGTAIRTGHMSPPLGLVRLGPVTLDASVTGCPSFPRCIGHGQVGVLSPPLPYKWPFQYIVVVYLPSLSGQAAYTLFDVVVEGEFVSIVIPDY
jgi:hypothetical protein